MLVGSALLPKVMPVDNSDLPKLRARAEIVVDDGGCAAEGCPRRRLPLPVRVCLRPSRRLEDGFLVGWRVEGRRVLAVVELLGRGERVEVDPWDLYGPGTRSS